MPRAPDPGAKTNLRGVAAHAARWGGTGRAPSNPPALGLGGRRGHTRRPRELAGAVGEVATPCTDGRPPENTPPWLGLHQSSLPNAAKGYPPREPRERGEVASGRTFRRSWRSWRSWSGESRSCGQHRCRRRTRRRDTRAPAWRVGRPTTSGCATSALGKRPRATRSFRRRTTRSRWRAPPSCWTAWRKWARTTPCCAARRRRRSGGSDSARMPGRRSTATLSCPPGLGHRIAPRDLLRQ